MLSRRIVIGVVIMVGVTVLGWTYYRSLVPAIHPDHDHALENLAGGGFLRVEAVEGGQRNLVGRPGKVLILHWFELGGGVAVAELPALVDYSNATADDPGVEVVLIAMNQKRDAVRSWASGHGVPTAKLYVDPQGKTASLIGVRSVPETLIYDAEGHLVHQARGPMDWSSAETRAAIDGFKAGGEGHTH